MAGTLLYINGFTGDMKVKDFLGGMLAPAGTKVINVPYPNQWYDGVSEAHAETAIANLDQALADNPGTVGDPTVVVGHSAGAQFIYKWIRELGPTSLVDPTKVVFYAVGCPEQKYTGASYRYPAESPPIYPGGGSYGTGGWGIPLTGVPWELHTVANEYDGWADAPNDPDNVEVKKTVGGKAVHWSHSIFSWTKSSNGPHSGARYNENLDNAYSYNDTAQGTDVWYHWIPQTYMPRAKNLALLAFMRQSVEDEDRPTLNLAYNDRPVDLGKAGSAPAYSDPPAEPSNFFTWLFDLLGWG